MSASTAAKNALLDGVTITHLSLHSGYPGTTGANEISGGTPAYAKQSVTVNAASGGIRALNAAATFDVPASTVRWVGAWNAGTYLWAAPNGGATPKNFVSVSSSDLVYSPGHGYSDTQKIVFLQGVAPGGLTAGVVYFVRDATTDSFKVAATSGGAAIDLSSAASPGCWVCAITEDVYGSQGTHEVATSQFVVPD